MTRPPEPQDEGSIVRVRGHLYRRVSGRPGRAWVGASDGARCDRWLFTWNQIVPDAPGVTVEVLR